jgi:hypothetical protein
LQRTKRSAPLKSARPLWGNGYTRDFMTGMKPCCIPPCDSLSVTRTAHLETDVSFSKCAPPLLQTRILVTNILDRMLKNDGVKPEIFNSLVDKSNKMAKRNIIARTPELKSLIEEFQAYLPEDMENPDRKEKKHA